MGGVKGKQIVMCTTPTNSTPISIHGHHTSPGRTKDMDQAGFGVKMD